LSSSLNTSNEEAVEELLVLISTAGKDAVAEELESAARGVLTPTLLAMESAIPEIVAIEPIEVRLKVVLSTL
jgi:hypothetical protein